MPSSDSELERSARRVYPTPARSCATGLDRRVENPAETAEFPKTLRKPQSFGKETLSVLFPRPRSAGPLDETIAKRGFRRFSGCLDVDEAHHRRRDNPFYTPGGGCVERRGTLNLCGFHRPKSRGRRSRQGSGKRGGVQVVYFYYRSDVRLYLLMGDGRRQGGAARPLPHRSRHGGAARPGAVRDRRRVPALAALLYLILTKARVG